MSRSYTSTSRGSSVVRSNRGRGRGTGVATWTPARINNMDSSPGNQTNPDELTEDGQQNQSSTTLAGRMQRFSCSLVGTIFIKYPHNDFGTVV